MSVQVKAAAQHSSIGKTVVSAGTKSVSRMNAMLQKTSKAVKVLAYLMPIISPLAQFSLGIQEFCCANLTVAIKLVCAGLASELL